MNPEVKAKWVAALRSGDYKQGKKYLRDNERFCCLGVLCDLHAQATGREWKVNKSEGVETYMRRYGQLPVGVARWAGLKSVDPKVGWDPLSVHNDYNDVTFSQIADLIEEHL